jgi:RNA polymerase sigma factor (sigma-70 family)
MAFLAGVSGVMVLVGAFEELFRAEYPRLVRSLAVAHDAALAEDAVQEAFIAAQRRWPDVAGLDDPAGWVRRVAVNRLANSRRNRRRRTEILATVRPPDPATLEAADLDLLRAIEALPSRQRLTLCLHHLAGYTVAEVAEMLAVAPGTVKSNLHDARSALRRALEVPDAV